MYLKIDINLGLASRYVEQNCFHEIETILCMESANGFDFVKTDLCSLDVPQAWH